MAILSPQKIDLSKINGGIEFRNGDVVTPEALNSAIEGSAYAIKLSEEAKKIAEEAKNQSGSGSGGESGSGSGSGDVTDCSNCFALPEPYTITFPSVPTADYTGEQNSFVPISTTLEQNSIPLRDEYYNFEVGDVRVNDRHCLSMENFGNTPDNHATSVYLYTEESGLGFVDLSKKHEGTYVIYQPDYLAEVTLGYYVYNPDTNENDKDTQTLSGSSGKIVLRVYKKPSYRPSVIYERYAPRKIDEDTVYVIVEMGVIEDLIEISISKDNRSIFYPQPSYSLNEAGIPYKLI